VHNDAKAKIGRHSIGNVSPFLTVVVRAIQAPVILQEETFGTIGMQSYLVHALPKLGIFVGHEHNADALVLGGPGASAILGSIDASRRDSHIHALAVRRIQHDGVQSESAISRHPAGTMRMIEQASHE
jgi:hypothetical protein